MKKQSPPPIQLPTYRFRSDEFAERRKKIIISFIITLVACCIIIFCLLTMYWAALFKQYSYNYTVAVVDFDGTVIGQTVQQTFQNQLDTNDMTLGYTIFNNETGRQRFPNGNDDIFNAVLDEKYWAAIIVNANASSLLDYAYNFGNASYDPTGAIFVIYNEARSFQPADQFFIPFVFPLMTQLRNRINTILAGEFARRLAADNSGNLLANAQLAPQIAGSPIGYSIFNIRPFNVPVAFAGIQVGVVYFIVLSFFVILIISEAHKEALFLSKILYVLYRIFLPTILYLFISLFYSLLSLQFGLPFDKRYNEAAGFTLYWILNFVTMVASGLVLENFNNFIGEPALYVFLDFWIIVNVSTSEFSIPFSASFYQLGYALPFHHNVSASKAITFDTKNYLGENFGVIMAWVVVNYVILPFSILFHRKKLMRKEEELRQQVKDKEKEEAEQKNLGRRREENAKLNVN